MNLYLSAPNYLLFYFHHLEDSAPLINTNLMKL